MKREGQPSHGKMDVGVLCGATILVVDDDPEIVAAVATLMGDAGALVATAMDGDEAIRAIDESHPDVIVLDALLPKRSGFHVLERLARAGKTRGSRPFVIVITGVSGKRHRDWVESHGADDFLSKPFRMEQLITSIERCLSTS